MLFCFSNGEFADESSVTTNVAVVEVAEVQRQQQQLEKKEHVGAGTGAAATVCQTVLNGNSAAALNQGNIASSVGRVTSRSHMEQEKRMRREIANSNERRRMQSINAGFQSLRTLLPHHEGEKLSKVINNTANDIIILCIFPFHDFFSLECC